MKQRNEIKLSTKNSLENDIFEIPSSTRTYNQNIELELCNASSCNLDESLTTNVTWCQSNFNKTVNILDKLGNNTINSLKLFKLEDV